MITLAPSGNLEAPQPIEFSRRLAIPHETSSINCSVLIDAEVASCRR